MEPLKPIHWGIVGCGVIAHDFCAALSALPKEKHCIYRIASTELTRAEEYANKFSILKYSNDYNDVFNDKIIDIVYIATITFTHKNLCIKAMESGKSVLCEKPLTVNLNELEEVIECAKKKKVFFMEAMWTRCLPLYASILNNIDNGFFGEVTAVTATFGLDEANDIPRFKTPEHSSCLLTNCGVYAITVGDVIFQGEPGSILCHGIIDKKSGLDRTESITIAYRNKKHAHFIIDGDRKLTNECIVHFTKGVLTIHESFWCASSYSFKDNEGKILNKTFPTINKSKFDFIYDSEGLMYEAEHVYECLKSSKLESDIVTHETSRRVMKYVDECRRQLGINFWQDKV